MQKFHLGMLKCRQIIMSNYYATNEIFLQPRLLIKLSKCQPMCACATSNKCILHTHDTVEWFIACPIFPHWHLGGKVDIKIEKFFFLLVRSIRKIHWGAKQCLLIISAISKSVQHEIDYQQAHCYFYGSMTSSLTVFPRKISCLYFFDLGKNIWSLWKKTH